MDYRFSSCAHHPLRNAAGIGPRCGDFLCQDCLLDDAEKCCTRCQIRQKAKGRRQLENGIMLILFNLFCGSLILKVRSLTSVVLIIAVPVVLLLMYMRMSPAPEGPGPHSDSEDEDDDGSPPDENASPSEAAEDQAILNEMDKAADIMNPDNTKRQGPPYLD